MARILLAEDDVSMRSFLTLALERAGHEVISAADGLEALEALKTLARFDLLLADIVMPGMDGIELSRQATKICADLKVMFITGFAAVALDQQEKMKAGGHARVLSKPFHLNDLVGQINGLLAA